MPAWMVEIRLMVASSRGDLVEVAGLVVGSVNKVRISILK